MKKFEAVLYGAVIALLCTALIAEGQRATTLTAQKAVTARELYRLLSNPQVQVQVVDLRPYDEDHYLDTHIPGAIPLPGCDLATAPEKARTRVFPYVQTVIVTEEGDAQAFDACRAQFKRAQRLEGGMNGWVNAQLPEDTGEYSPPKSGAGGGCL